MDNNHAIIARPRSAPRSSRRAAAVGRTPTQHGDVHAGKLTSKGQQTRERLISGARKVFEAVGFVEARIRDIADAAGTAHGSFYTYFSSKEEILLAAMVEIYKEQERAMRLDERPSSHAEGIAKVNMQYFDTCMRNRKMLATVDQVAGFLPEFNDRRTAAHRAHVDRYGATLREMQEEGVIDADLDPYYTACALGSMVEQSIRWWIGHYEPVDREVALETLQKLWTRSIGLDRPVDLAGAHDQS
ncbi:MAG: TetR/AcrR family transcriptional regulator [Actinomycetota bacterium]